MLPNELLWIFQIHISGNNVYLLSVNRKQWRDGTESGCPGGLSIVRCHGIVIQKIEWNVCGQSLNSVVTFFPGINQTTKMDTTHWKDLSVVMFLKSSDLIWVGKMLTGQRFFFEVERVLMFKIITESLSWNMFKMRYIHIQACKHIIFFHLSVMTED